MVYMTASLAQTTAEVGGLLSEDAQLIAENAGLLNRHAMQRALDAEFIRSRTQGQVLSLALFDVDGLKRVNDTHGHLAGDALLRSLAGCVTRCKRSYDILGRWGGDEFS